MKTSPKKLKFSDWLQSSLAFMLIKPWVWFGYCAYIGLVMIVGKASLALGIFLAVTHLFVGIGLAKYIDLRASDSSPVSLGWAVQKSLPLAVLAAGAVVSCWFVFMLIANLLAGDYLRILQFFFHWELTPENLQRETSREVAAWLFSYANVALVFAILMLGSFAGLFSHPLMLFRNYRWSEAKQQSDRVVARNQTAVYKMLGFIFFEALLCMTVTPLLTPVLYMLTATSFYVAYKHFFTADEEENHE